jgi:hypothetical protein
MDYYTKKIISFKDVVFKKTKTMKLWENIRKKQNQQKKNCSLVHHVLNNTKMLIDQESINFYL